jgi:hypothetical protein
MDEDGQECRHCGEFRPWEAFKADRRLPSGYTTLCKECYNARARDRYEERLEAARPSAEEIEAKNARDRAANRARRSRAAAVKKWLGAKGPPKPGWVVEPTQEPEEPARAESTDSPAPEKKKQPKRKSKLEVAETKPRERDPWADEKHWRPFPGDTSRW